MDLLNHQHLVLKTTSMIQPKQSISEGVVYNSIISGNLETEVSIRYHHRFPGQLNLDFKIVLFNLKKNIKMVFIKMLFGEFWHDNNTDPQFNSITDMDYGFGSNSLLQRQRFCHFSTD